MQKRRKSSGAEDSGLSFRRLAAQAHCELAAAPSGAIAGSVPPCSASALSRPQFSSQVLVAPGARSDCCRTSLGSALRPRPERSSSLQNPSLSRPAPGAIGAGPPACLVRGCVPSASFRRRSVPSAVASSRRGWERRARGLGWGLHRTFPSL